MRLSTACGGTIVIPPKTQEHLLAHPEVGELLAEAVGRIVLPTDVGGLAIEVEMGRIVGRSGCVQTEPITPAEPAVFALRVGRERPSRVVAGVSGPWTTKVVVLASPAQEEARMYVLATAYVGQLAPKEPWDGSLVPGSEAHRESLDFWCRHALVHNPSVMGAVFESSWGEILA